MNRFFISLHGILLLSFSPLKVYRELPEVKAVESLFLPDKLHLNMDGYHLWKTIISQELDKVLKPE